MILTNRIMFLHKNTFWKLYNKYEPRNFSQLEQSALGGEKFLEIGLVPPLPAECATSPAHFVVDTKPARTSRSASVGGGRRGEWMFSMQ